MFSTTRPPLSRDGERPPPIHERPELFAELVRRCVDELDRPADLVEKDYWVTHTLDALQRSGFEVHFKGGTSLSKGFALIERFSEDLDLKLDAHFLPFVDDRVWRRGGDQARDARRAFFDELLRRELPTPLSWRELAEFNDEKLRNIGIRVDYPQTMAATNPVMRAYVLLEVGRARVTPYVEREVSSWVHDELARAGVAVERPVVRCVHPLVTFFEKASALQGRASRDDVDPARYVRHFEDAVHIIRAWEAGRLPLVPGYYAPKALAAELVRTKDIKPLNPNHPAFSPTGDRAERQRQALDDLAGYYWGPRVRFEEATEEIRAWLASNL